MRPLVKQTVVLVSLAGSIEHDACASQRRAPCWSLPMRRRRAWEQSIGCADHLGGVGAEHLGLGGDDLCC